MGSEGSSQVESHPTPPLIDPIRSQDPSRQPAGIGCLVELGRMTHHHNLGAAGNHRNVCAQTMAVRKTTATAAPWMGLEEHIRAHVPTDHSDREVEFNKPPDCRPKL